MAFATDIQVQPTAGLDDLARLTALIQRAEPSVRRRFLEAVDASRTITSLEEISDLIAAGRIDDALQIAGEVGPTIASSLEQVYVSAGLSSAAVLRSQAPTLIDFNQTNVRAVRVLQSERLRLVAEFTSEQRAATLELLGDGFARGLAPIEQARTFRSSIGLTRRQAQAVTNYRRLLSGSASEQSEALTRALRDRRFDGTVRRSIREGIPLTPAEIDRMVERYSERYVKYRAETIAKTETVAAAHAGDEEMWRQAIEGGEVVAEEIEQIWRISRINTRPSHVAMEGQVRPFGEPFISGDGNALRYPGDPNAPARDTVNCHCVIERRLKRPSAVG